MPDIDFVITWVNGSDPAHEAMRQKFSPENENGHRGAGAKTRFKDNGEIYYLIASILKYAPFVRRVYIVTDNQKPESIDIFSDSGLCDRSFLKVVSHDVIFDGLNAIRPTFSSRSIEAAIWRIPGLSEHFVYSNDDMFLNAPLEPENFFRDGRPVLHGSIAKLGYRRFWRRLSTAIGRHPLFPPAKPMHGIAQQKGADLAGSKGEFFYAEHVPHPLRVSTLSDFYAANQAVLDRQLKYRFRNIDQHYPISLANNIEINRYGAPIFTGNPAAYIRPGRNRSSRFALQSIRDETTLFACLQNMEELPTDLRRTIHAVLRKKFELTLPSGLGKLDHALG